MYKKLFINKTLQNNEFKQIISLLEQKNISISFVETKTDFTDKDNALFIGINAQDSDLAQELNIDFALATWSCHDFKHIQAKYYFRQPYDILNTLTMIEKPYINHKWLTTAMEMQFIAQAGLDVVPTRLIAIHDRNRHNVPLYAYGITKIFMLCEVISGKFNQNIETSASAYFTLDNLPNLSLGKNTKEQIELCFAAYKDKNWVPVID